MSFKKTDVKVFCTVTPESSHVHYILLHFPHSVSQKQETDPTHTPGEGGGWEAVERYEYLREE